MIEELSDPAAGQDSAAPCPPMMLDDPLELLAAENALASIGVLTLVPNRRAQNFEPSEQIIRISVSVSVISFADSLQLLGCALLAGGMLGVVICLTEGYNRWLYVGLVVTGLGLLSMLTAMIIEAREEIRWNQE